MEKSVVSPKFRRARIKMIKETTCTMTCFFHFHWMASRTFAVLPNNKTKSNWFLFSHTLWLLRLYRVFKLNVCFVCFRLRNMDHLSPPPSPPTNSSAESKLLNYPKIMNGLDKLHVTMSPSSLIQRANLNTALKLNRGKYLRQRSNYSRPENVEVLTSLA